MDYESRDIEVTIPKVIKPEPREVTIDVPKDLVKEKPIDWTRIALAGGGGLLAHSMVSSLLEKSEEEKRKESIWSKVLRTVLPIGAGVLGAYAGSEAGKGLGKFGAANEKPKAEPKKEETRQYAAKELKWNSGPGKTSKTVVPPDQAETAGAVLKSWKGQPAARYWDEMVPAHSNERDMHKKLWYGGALASEGIAGFNLYKLIRKGLNVPALRRARESLRTANNAVTLAKQLRTTELDTNPIYRTPTKNLTEAAKAKIRDLDDGVAAIEQEAARRQGIVDDISKKTKGMGWNAFFSLASQIPAGWSAYKGYQAGLDVDRVKALSDWYNSDEGRAVLKAYLEGSNPSAK